MQPRKCHFGSPAARGNRHSSHRTGTRQKPRTSGTYSGEYRISKWSSPSLHPLPSEHYLHIYNGLFVTRRNVNGKRQSAVVIANVSTVQGKK